MAMTKGVTAMAADPLKHHYACLTPAERFALTIEAMARGDENEADRLEDACPKDHYHLDDREYRDRMHRAYIIALMNMRRGLSQVWMAKTFREMAPDYGYGPELLAKVAFLHGREYGKWELGAIEQIELIDAKALVAELDTNQGLRQQMDDVKELVGEAMAKVAETLMAAVGEAFASDLLSQWEGFGRFCKEVLALEPLTLLKALKLAEKDPAAQVLESYLDAKPDEAKAAEWKQTWTRNWERRSYRPAS
jgi:hypothetical protein